MTDNRQKFRACRWLAPICAVFMAVSSALAVQASQSQEEEVQKLLNQADNYSQRGDYKLAIGGYLEAAALAQSKPNLSRAYFGLALSYFYLRDMANSVKWMRKVSEVDPNKEISELFYPKGFAQLFNQVQKERREKLAAEGGGEAAKQGVPEKSVEAHKPIQQDAKKEEAPAEKAVPPPASKPEAVEKAAPVGVTTGGHWEVGAHYSLWGLNLIKGLFEKSLTSKLGDAIQSKVVKYLQARHPGLVQSSYSQELSFDSSGPNYGLEVRYYSKGRAGTFSFGFSLEKTHIKLAVAGPVKVGFTNGGVATVTGNGLIETSPLTTNFSFRWDFSLGHIVTPYFVAGFGFSSWDGAYNKSWSGEFQLGAAKETISEVSEPMDFAGLSEDLDFNLPKMFIVIQLSFGVKAEVYPGAFVLAEAGIWDGLMLRFGAAYRF
jgi:tetratricopeptide (TPR) repeat protein